MMSRDAAEEKSQPQLVLCNRTVMAVVSSLGILLSPLLGSRDGLCLIFFPSLRDIVGEWVIGVWDAEESLNREENGADLERRRPVA